MIRSSHQVPRSEKAFQLFQASSSHLTPTSSSYAPYSLVRCLTSLFSRNHRTVSLASHNRYLVQAPSKFRSSQSPFSSSSPSIVSTNKLSKCFHPTSTVTSTSFFSTSPFRASFQGKSPVKPSQPQQSSAQAIAFVRASNEVTQKKALQISAASLAILGLFTGWLYQSWDSSADNTASTEPTFKHLSMHAAADAKDRKLLEQLLQGGGNPNTPNVLGETVLHRAVAKDKEDIVLLLLKNGADPNLADHKGETVLHRAISKSAGTELIRLLLVHHANPNVLNKKKRTPLHKAAKRDYNSDARLLLQYGADPNIRDCNGETPLAYAISKSSGTEMLRILLHHAADPNVKDNFGEGPLHKAVRKNYKSDVRALLRHGANPDLPDSNGNTPLLLAVSNEGGYEIVRALLKYGADPSRPNNAKLTPLQCARSKQVKALLDLYDKDKTASRKEKAEKHEVKTKKAERGEDVEETEVGDDEDAGLKKKNRDDD